MIEGNKVEKFDIELARSKLGALKCEKGLICAQSGLESLCKAKSIRSELFAICEEKDPECQFKLRFGAGYMCKCPVRIFLANKFRK